ncbi:MAG: hypothetical protein CBD38_03310 [bacterium TMED178]|nr:MAG: hypothetical protein CBD38_03310 [bacterium TMED178]|tara:strand:+ start:605 stop:1342 length:738 start_codon:yes stop_codon:yes gene_type:complete
MTSNKSTVKVSDMTTETVTSKKDIPVEELEQDKYRDLMVKIDEMSKQLKGLSSYVKELRKENLQLVKELAKQEKKKAKKAEDRAKKGPSGFARPTEITPELAKFLGIPADEKIARTDVTKKITGYVKEHNLQQADNKRVILLKGKHGKALAKVLSPVVDPVTGDSVDLTFFNLQRYLKHHFPKTTATKAPEKKATKAPEKKATKASEKKATKAPEKEVKKVTKKSSKKSKKVKKSKVPLAQGVKA